MGRGTRHKPDRLGEKLACIRAALGLSQNEMISRLGLSEELLREEISAFELGKRQPPLRVILGYARSVGLSTDVLIDDEMDLPEWVISAAKNAPVQKAGRRKSTKTARRKR